MQDSFFIEDLPVAASTDQLMVEYQSSHDVKMSEVIQNQSLNIQKPSFKGVLIKGCSEICSRFTGEHLC